MADVNKILEKPPAEEKQVKGEKSESVEESSNQMAEHKVMISKRRKRNKRRNRRHIHREEGTEKGASQNFFNQAQKWAKVMEKEPLSGAAERLNVGTPTPPTDMLFVEGNHKSVIDSFKDKPTVCVYHKQKEVSLFCRTCGRLICSLCIVQGSHGNHKLCEADGTRKEMQSKLTKIIQNESKELTENLKTKEREIKIQKDCVRESFSKVATEINQHTAKVQLELEKWSQSLQTLVMDHQGRQIQTLEEQQFQSETCLSFLEMFQTNPSAVEILSGTKMIQILQILQNIMDTSKQTNPVVAKREIPLTFVAGTGVTEENSHKLFGSVSGLDNNSSVSMATTYISKNMEDSGPVETTATVDVNDFLPDEDDVYEDAVEFSTRYHFGDGPIDRISPVDATNAFVVTQQKLYLLDLSKAHTKGYLKQTKPLMTDVIHITPITKLGIYVQQPNSTLVKRVTTSGQVYRFIDVQTTCGKTSLQCIGMTHSGMVISTTVTDAKKTWGGYLNIRIHNKDGIPCLSVVKDMYNERISIYDSMRDAVITDSGLFIVNTTRYTPRKSNKNNGKIRNMTKETTYRGVIGSTPVSQFNPRGICQDQHGRLIVSDYWNHAIHQLTTEGKFRKFLMREEDGLTYPTAVAIDNYSYLWIGQKDGTVHIIKYIP